jgi:putative ABC transport system permease protein
MRSALVVFQFTTSIVLIIGTFIIHRQMGYILNKKIGFNKEQVVLLHGTNTLGGQVKTLKNELLRLPTVQSVSISDYLPIKGTKRNGNSFWKEGKSKEERSVGGQMWEVDHDYVKTLGLKLVAGRDFSAQLASDSGAVIINQAMAKELRLQKPVGARIMNWRTWNVIGVVENFHFESLRDSIGPICLRLDLSPSIVSVRVKTTDIAGAVGAISGLWKTFSPHQPIRYTFLDESFARMYEDVQRTGRIFTTFAVLALAVACLGLFALSAFLVEQRGKEISIRLVLGASVSNIFGLLTFNFLRLVLISFVIAVPIGWYLMHKWLEDFVYRTKLSADVFILAGVAAVAIAVLTISYQSVKAALMSPVRRLKAE